MEKEAAASAAKAAAAKAEKDAAKAAQAARQEAAKAAEAAAKQAAKAARTATQSRTLDSFGDSETMVCPRPAAPTRHFETIKFACDRYWEELTDAEQRVADSLGFGQWFWDAHVIGLNDDNDHIRLERFEGHTYPGCPDGRAFTSGFAPDSLWNLHDIIGVRLHNPVDMTASQRERSLTDAELHPCYLVRGEFSPGWSGNPDEPLVPATRWVHIEDVAKHALDYTANDEADDGDFPEYIKALETYTATVKRLWQAARAKAVAEVEADKAEAAAAARSPAAPAEAAASEVALAAPTAAVPTAAAPVAAPPTAGGNAARKRPIAASSPSSPRVSPRRSGP